jgi:hypothetical protein
VVGRHPSHPERVDRFGLMTCVLSSWV